VISATLAAHCLCRRLDRPRSTRYVSPWPELHDLGYLTGRWGCPRQRWCSTNEPRRHPMTSTVDLKRTVCEAVDAMRAELVGISRAIHAEPELAFQEEKAAARL